MRAQEQMRHLRENMNIPPIVVSPFDAELFGHWWFEGPEWLEVFIRKGAYDQQEFQFTTPTEYLCAQRHASDAGPLRLELGAQGLLGGLAR